MRRVTPSSRAAICTKPPRRISSRSSPKRSSPAGSRSIRPAGADRAAGRAHRAEAELSKPMAKIVVNDLQKDLQGAPLRLD